MSKFFTILTKVGEAKLANATALGQTVQFEKLAVGDGNGDLPTPDQNQTALINEVRRALLNAVEIDPNNPNWIICEQVIPEDVGGWTIREVGIYDVDGDLIAVGNFPETYKPILEEGSGRTQTVRIVLQVSSSSSVELKIDPSIVLATRDYVDKKVKEHEDKPDPHPQYTQLKHLTGLIGEFHDSGAKPGWVDLKGGELSRTTDKLLWDYAVAAGMTVAQATKDADPMTHAMKFGDGDGATTFTLPNHHLGHFVRGTPSGVSHGQTQGDAIRNIKGSVNLRDDTLPNSVRGLAGHTGVFTAESGSSSVHGIGTKSIGGGVHPEMRSDLIMNASLQVPTAQEVRPYTANISIKIHRGWM